MFLRLLLEEVKAGAGLTESIEEDRGTCGLVNLHMLILCTTGHVESDNTGRTTIATLV